MALCLSFFYLKLFVGNTWYFITAFLFFSIVYIYQCSHLHPLFPDWPLSHKQWILQALQGFKRSQSLKQAISFEKSCQSWWALLLCSFLKLEDNLLKVESPGLDSPLASTVPWPRQSLGLDSPLALTVPWPWQSPRCDSYPVSTVPWPRQSLGLDSPLASTVPWPWQSPVSPCGFFKPFMGLEDLTSLKWSIDLITSKLSSIWLLKWTN